VRCGSFWVDLVDSASFLSAHQEIFVEEIYRFPFEGDSPSIVDLGANIGLATLWFKRQYPGARIVALEPDPDVFACLERNVRQNRLAGLELVNKAAWSEDATLRFVQDGADGGRAADPADARLADRRQVVEVQALAIEPFLAGRPIDFLKIDIEGAEAVVLAACRAHLPRIRWLFVEYHARKGQPSELGGIVEVIESAGFRLHVESLGARKRPFAGPEPSGDFDLQLNLYAWR
jgi:FkbM family methyltransferase